MENGPEHAVCEATVVFLVVLFGEVERDVRNLVVDDLACRDPTMRRDFSTPAEPNAGFLLECCVDGNFKPAGTRASISLGNGDSV